MATDYTPEEYSPDPARLPADARDQARRVEQALEQTLEVSVACARLERELVQGVERHQQCEHLLRTMLRSDLAVAEMLQTVAAAIAALATQMAEEAAAHFEELDAR
jgi:DNA anti-recombination protein RmuC